ncbi:MAG: hypothetical protein AAF066_11195 [Pseudomonadota bacterium]
MTDYKLPPLAVFLSRRSPKAAAFLSGFVFRFSFLAGLIVNFPRFVGETWRDELRYAEAMISLAEAIRSGKIEE